MSSKDASLTTSLGEEQNTSNCSTIAATVDVHGENAGQRRNSFQIGNSEPRMGLTIWLAEKL